MKLLGQLWQSMPHSVEALEETNQIEFLKNLLRCIKRRVNGIHGGCGALVRM